MRMSVLAVLSIVLGLTAGMTTAHFIHHDAGREYTRMLSLSLEAPASANDPSRPRVVVENGDDYDFGIMEYEDTLSHTFVIRNLTEAPLTLRIVEKTCKCTVGRLPGEAIPPGETGEVNLEWTARSFATEFRQSATLETSDPVRSVITLSVHGRILRLVVASPPDLAFSDVPFGEGREQTLMVYSYHSADFAVEGAAWLDDALAPHMDVEILPGTAADLTASPTPLSAVRCQVRLKPTMPLGRFEQRLILRTNEPRTPKVEIPIAGNIVSDVQLIGAGYRRKEQVLELGVIDAASGLTRPLRLSVRGEYREAFRVEEVVTEPSNCLQVTVGEAQTLNAGKVISIPLTLTVPPGCKPVHLMGFEGRPTARLIIRTNHPVAGEIPIEVRLAIVSSR